MDFEGERLYSRLQILTLLRLSDIISYMRKEDGAKPRSSGEKHEKIQAVLESHGRFDFEYIPTGDNWKMPDENFAYRKKFPESLINGFWRVFLQLFSPILIKVAHGAKVVGKRNLKTVKRMGALCICNHIGFLDTLFVRHAVGYFRSFHTMTEKNNKGGIGGHVIRHGGMLPFSANFTATKNLIKEMKRLLDKGKIINFYAERAMWIGYQKPRPMKEGTFTYAVKFDVPVIPIFCTFERSKKGHMKKVRIHVLPAIFPDESLPRRERADKMRIAAEQAWKDCYESSYGKKLTYLCDSIDNQ